MSDPSATSPTSLAPGGSPIVGGVPVGINHLQILPPINPAVIASLTLPESAAFVPPIQDSPGLAINSLRSRVFEKYFREPRGHALYRYVNSLRMKPGNWLPLVPLDTYTLPDQWEHCYCYQDPQAPIS